MGEYNEYKKVWIKREEEAAKKKRAAKIFQVLQKHNPHSKTALHFKTPMQLLAAVILSTQSTDKKVNEITDRHLFKKYKTPADFARAAPKVFEKEISQLGLYHAKAKAILTLAEMIAQKFGSKLPRTNDGRNDNTPRRGAKNRQYRFMERRRRNLRHSCRHPFAEKWFLGQGRSLTCHL